MYVLVELKDIIRIPPELFNLPQEEAIADELNRKLSNRVIINVGLCICLFDITKICESFIFQGDGAAHTQIHFRFVVFRPFIGEVLVGKLRSCSRDGIRVSLDFFDDIIISPQNLQEPSRFDEKEQMWVWEYESEDGKHDFFMDVGEKIRFKVKEEIFTDTSPPGPSGSGTAITNDLNTSNEGQRKIPYMIKGTISEPGLGLINWWK